MYILGLDIGGTHISGGLTDACSGYILGGSPISCPIRAADNEKSILAEWVNGIIKILGGISTGSLQGMGIAMPGPFDYENGISLIKGLSKYEALYGVNVRNELKNRLQLRDDFPVYFENDAVCFVMGEYAYGRAKSFSKVLAVTLGTGTGSAFLQNGQPVKSGKTVPAGGMIYHLPYQNGIADDRFSARGLLQDYEKLSCRKADNVQRLYELAEREETIAVKVFADFGKDFGKFLVPLLKSFEAECLLLGGNVSHAFPFFGKALKETLDQNQLTLKIVLSELKEKAAILGAASLVKKKLKKDPANTGFRKTKERLLPLKKDNPDNQYDIYPVFHLPDHSIYTGINSLINYIIEQKTVIIDGYAGIFWEKLKQDIKNYLPAGLKINMQDTNEWFLSETEIEKLVTPYLGEKDAVWGTKCDRTLSDFFDHHKIASYSPDPASDINILIGTGAALSSREASVIYFDLPKNELQYRMRAGRIFNLGTDKISNQAEMYKRSYFVDWVVLNRHKKDILKRIKIVADSQRPDAITWIFFNDLENALQKMSENIFRVRPWFEPGAWGGQWIKKNIPGVNREEVNYAWSFELITPENGLLLESNELMLEISFDFMMFLHNRDVLGEKHADRFGDEFPIRFDFLDTVRGGNLSIQCHPSLNYIRENFGECFTQDETYYILEADKASGVYLGFQEDIDPVSFRKELEDSYNKKVEVDITRFVQYHPSKRHDLFLIPNGTIHSAGKGNLVLEISATPYIFTFKMYDWLRLDLNGEPRPINIERAFHNLHFDRKGERVKEELISQPYLLNEGEGWKCDHLPTHPAHFYDIHRYEFEDKVEIDTNGSCHVLMLVEGSLILVATKNGFRQRFHYAETFVIPAAAESYLLINEGAGKAKVVKAFLKD